MRELHELLETVFETIIYPFPPSVRYAIRAAQAGKTESDIEAFDPEYDDNDPDKETTLDRELEAFVRELIRDLPRWQPEQTAEAFVLLVLNEQADLVDPVLIADLYSRVDWRLDWAKWPDYPQTSLWANLLFRAVKQELPPRPGSEVDELLTRAIEDTNITAKEIREEWPPYPYEVIKSWLDKASQEIEKEQAER